MGIEQNAVGGLAIMGCSREVQLIPPATPAKQSHFSAFAKVLLAYQSVPSLGPNGWHHVVTCFARPRQREAGRKADTPSASRSDETAQGSASHSFAWNDRMQRRWTLVGMLQGKAKRKHVANHFGGLYVKKSICKHRLLMVVV